MSAKVHNGLHNQHVVAQVAVAYPQHWWGLRCRWGDGKTWGGNVKDGNSGLPLNQPELMCLIPAIRVRYEPEYVLVTLAGELDFAAVAGLRERLFALTATGRQVVADLERVSFIDAAGIGVLAGAARRAAVHGSALYVVCGRRQTRRLFRLTGLDRVVSLTGTLSEALQLLPQAARAGATAV
jgi:anti-anti-sigma factor